jgi:hypothetical protein
VQTALKTDNSAFYLFNVVHGTANPFYDHLSLYLGRHNTHNVRASLGCRGDRRYHSRSNSCFSSAPSGKRFCSSQASNQEVRASSGREGALWRTRFALALRPAAGIAAKAPSLSYELMPHLQTQIYAVSTLIVPFLTAYELTISDAERHNRIGHVAHACRCCCRQASKLLNWELHTLRVERANALVLLPNMTILY